MVWTRKSAELLRLRVRMLAHSTNIFCAGKNVLFACSNTFIKYTQGRTTCWLISKTLFSSFWFEWGEILFPLHWFVNFMILTLRSINLNWLLLNSVECYFRAFVPTRTVEIFRLINHLKCTNQLSVFQQSWLKKKTSAARHTRIKFLERIGSKPIFCSLPLVPNIPHHSQTKWNWIYLPQGTTIFRIPINMIPQANRLINGLLSIFINH